MRSLQKVGVVFFDHWYFDLSLTVLVIQSLVNIRIFSVLDSKPGQYEIEVLDHSVK